MAEGTLAVRPFPERPHRARFAEAWAAHMRARRLQWLTGAVLLGTLTAIST